MTLDEVRARIDAILACDDTEAMHGMEDDLMVDVLRAIADGRASHPTVMAAETAAVASRSVTRWYA